MKIFMYHTYYMYTTNEPSKNRFFCCYCYMYCYCYGTL